jgi:hypothetical protein
MIPANVEVLQAYFQKRGARHLMGVSLGGFTQPRLISSTSIEIRSCATEWFWAASARPTETPAFHFADVNAAPLGGVVDLVYKAEVQRRKLMCHIKVLEEIAKRRI